MTEVKRVKSIDNTVRLAPALTGEQAVTHLVWNLFSGYLGGPITNETTKTVGWYGWLNTPKYYENCKARVWALVLGQKELTRKGLSLRKLSMRPPKKGLVDEEGIQPKFS
jgi:hypothetical protein